MPRLSRYRSAAYGVLSGTAAAAAMFFVAIAERRQAGAADTVIPVLVLGVLVLVTLGSLAIWPQSRRRWQYQREIDDSKRKLDTAINHMSQGLVMMDASQRIVLCNRRYIEMYRLSPAIVKPGLSFRDLLMHRRATGCFFGDIDEYCETVTSSVAEGKTTRRTTDVGAGRRVEVINEPLDGGGWVTTHEDVTEREQLLQAQEHARQVTRRQKLQLDAALNSMIHGLCMFDAEGRIVLFNRRYTEIVGLGGEHLRGRSLLDVFNYRKAIGDFDGDPETEVARVVREAREGKFTVKERVRSDGMVLRLVDQPIEGGGWVATFEDVTEQRNAERERDRTRVFLDLIIDNVPSAIFVKNVVDRKYSLVNRAAERLWGLPRQAMIGRTAQDVFLAAEAARIEARDNELLAAGEAVFDEREILTSGDGTRSIFSRRLVLRNEFDQPQYILGVVDDVTERKAAQTKIAHLAHFDSLTGLPNRALFREQLEKELSFVERGAQLALFYLDLDNFKAINDTLGHPMGDELLKAVGHRLRGCLRESDLIARLGGDEFAIIQTGLQDPSRAELFAQRLREVVSGTPYNLNGHLIATNLSIGIALAPADGAKIDDLVRHADLALYGAKAEGGANYRYYEPEMNARMKRRRALEIDLRSAIANDEFVLYYQPLVNLRRGVVTGCEALLRWRHPQRGMIPPSEFIPVAEETGLIKPIGEWVLRQACAAAVDWPEHISVAVNVSAVQFRNTALALNVIATLGQTGLPAHRLELEITESVLMQNNAATLATLHQIKDLGVRISMDDFGTGYSSLSYLRSFPFDKIKIDRSFIADLSKGEDAVAIVQAILRLASSLKMKTTAEGVETPEQQRLLLAAGCTEMQGFLFGRPVPANEIVHLFNARKRPTRVA